MDDSIRTGKDRVPPGQYVTNKWPVLTYGHTPSIQPEKWTLRIFGLVDGETTLSWKELQALPRARVTADFHCVTRFSTLDNGWEGIATREVIRQVRIHPEASHVMVHCYGGYTTNLPLEDFLSEKALLADRHNGNPLPVDHGGPVRLVVPHLYAWKSAKWVNGIELMDEDRRGFWEENGYHTYGDPWLEERFSSQETHDAYQVRRRAKELGIVPKD
ncbi:MAG TPA: sulfite oxidase-like oxidoreductase [Thermoanaerobaculia bacterium]|jgi:DMSO/TMAO reductase YedYZ molybdopterin-dependent catalytic subunit|nr:sulfite oxidase-like oxidoreductase [Thermoanaerobaculia bacterium]